MIDSGDSSRPGGRISRAGAYRASTPPIQGPLTDGRSLSPIHNNNYPSRKQVVLPTVKRDYEKNGAPRDGIQYDSHMIGYSGHMTDHARGSFTTPDATSNKSLGSGASCGKVASNLEHEVAQMKLGEKRNDGRMEETAAEEARDHDIPSSTYSQDSCLTSHTPSLEPSQESLPSVSTSDDSVQVQLASSGDGNEPDQSSSDEGEEEEEDVKAPFELMGEFIEAVMDEDFEVADKLCKMILLYEPENAECKQFQPLIEEMLKREREAELLGSSSSDDDEDDDSDDDEEGSEDDSDDSDDDEQDGDDSEESSEESQEESSNEDEQDMVGQR